MASQQDVENVIREIMNDLRSQGEQVSDSDIQIVDISTDSVTLVMSGMSIENPSIALNLREHIKQTIKSKLPDIEYVLLY